MFMSKLIDDIPPCPAKHLGCATSIGAWGDMIASIGNAFSVMDRLGQEKCDFLYYGFDPSVAEFMRLQPRIGTVAHIIPINKEIYHQVYLTAFWSGLPPVRWLWDIIESTPFTMQSIWPTHMDRECQTRPYAPQYWKSAVLSEDAITWAKTVRAETPGPLYLFNPTSTHSSPLSAHWPLWKEALQWLLENSPYNFAWVGLEDVIGHPSHPRLVNLVAKTPSMMHVLALSRECDGMITTSNSLSMWSAVEEKRSLVACHRDLYHPNALYYKNWVHHPDNIIVNFTDGLEQFQAGARQLFAETLPKITEKQNG